MYLIHPRITVPLQWTPNGLIADVETTIEAPYDPLARAADYDQWYRTHRHDDRCACFGCAGDHTPDPTDEEIALFQAQQGYETVAMAPDSAEGYLSIELLPVPLEGCDSQWAALHGYPQEW